MLRWDRSGVFATQSVDYVIQTGTFVELMLGFIILDDPSQGIDTSATLLDKTSEGYQLMDSLASEDQEVLKMTVLPFAEDTVVSPDILPGKTADNVSTSPVISMVDEMPSTPHAPSLAPPSADDVMLPNPSKPPAETGDGRSVISTKDGAFVFQHVLDAFKTSLEKEFPRYRISIGKDTFLVARPIFQSTGIIGRGTRGYVAWHEQSGTSKFLKDAWRPDYVGVQAEGDILQSLNDGTSQPSFATRAMLERRRGRLITRSVSTTATTTSGRMQLFLLRLQTGRKRARTASHRRSARETFRRWRTCQRRACSSATCVITDW